MKVFRLAPRKFANDISGTGAKLYGGRWNEKGIPCIYTSESRALAMCEFAVHQTLETMPSTIQLVTLEVPNKSIFNVQLKKLPKDWRTYPTSFKLKRIGSELLEANNYLIIKVPSSIIPEESNYILNPMHRDFEKIKLVSSDKYDFDERFKI